MRTNHLWTITILVLLMIGGLAAWSLREPLESGVHFVRSQFQTNHAVRFVVVGDNHGDNPVYRKILDTIKDEKYDFVLNLADTSEHGTLEEFQAVKQLESTLSFPVYHTIGNHDIKSDSSREDFQTVFDQAPNIAITVKQVHVLILDDSDRKVGFSEETLTWLRSELEKDPSATYLLAYHRPFGLPLANVLGDDETSASRKTIAEFRELIKNYHIGYIFTAHIHTYFPYTLDGIPAVVSGGGGDPAQSAIGGPKNNLFHYLVVTVTGGQINVAMHRVQLSD